MKPIKIFIFFCCLLSNGHLAWAIDGDEKLQTSLMTLKSTLVELSETLGELGEQPESDAEKVVDTEDPKEVEAAADEIYKYMRNLFVEEEGARDPAVVELGLEEEQDAKGDKQ